jgi:hypothetical protein
MPKAPRWETAAKDEDYDAAATYLSLFVTPDQALRLAQGLKKSPVVEYRANDLLRASRLPLLAAADSEVVKDLKKVKKGNKISAVLLIRGNMGDGHLTVADGYHRICASYHLDPDSMIPCRIGDVSV